MECVEEAERAETETSVENKQKLHNQIQGLEAQLHNLHTVHTNIHTHTTRHIPSPNKEVSELFNWFWGMCSFSQLLYILILGCFYYYY